MDRLRYISINILSSLGLILTGAQFFLHLRGKELCFNEGCKIVESVLSLDPLIINGLGFLFFFAVILSLALAQGRRQGGLPIYILLLSALVAEGILLSIQIFIAHTFCSYCLLIATIIILITIIYDPKTALSGTVFIVLELSIFSLIRVPVMIPESVNLNQGTYAVKTCSNPVSVAYLIFSENCPHCKKVLRSLRGCVKCEIHFNPVSKINREILPGLIPIEGYRPEINILALKVFDIHSVPVLIERTSDGYKIIKGDKKIIHFINRQCFCPGSVIPGIPPITGSPLFQNGEEGVCSLQEQCK